MLSMHLPRGAVEMKMRAEGADVNILDLDPEGPSPNQPAKMEGAASFFSTALPASTHVKSLKLKDDPKFAKVRAHNIFYFASCFVVHSNIDLFPRVNSTSKC
jgi:hypothetical protein